MEDSELIKDDDLLLVKDVMTSALRLEANTTVGDAVQILSQKNVEYGVIIDERGKPLSIVTKEQLSTTNVDVFIRALTTNVPHPEPTEPYETLDGVVEARVKDFLINQDLIGIVVRELDNILGVLLRKLIVEHALSLVSMRRLPGSAGHLLLRCSKCPGDPKCPGVRLTYYDPDNPPTCKKGLEVKRAKK